MENIIWTEQRTNEEMLGTILESATMRTIIKERRKLIGCTLRRDSLFRR